MPAAAPPASARSAAPSPAGPGREETDSRPPSAGSVTRTPAASAASAAAPASASGKASQAVEGGRGAGPGRDLTSEEGASRQRKALRVRGARRVVCEREPPRGVAYWGGEVGPLPQEVEARARLSGPVRSRFAGAGSSFFRGNRWVAGQSPCSSRQKGIIVARHPAQPAEHCAESSRRSTPGNLRSAKAGQRPGGTSFGHVRGGPLETWLLWI